MIIVELKYAIGIDYDGSIAVLDTAKPDLTLEEELEALEAIKLKILGELENGKN